MDSGVCERPTTVAPTTPTASRSLNSGSNQFQVYSKTYPKSCSKFSSLVFQSKLDSPAALAFNYLHPLKMLNPNSHRQERIIFQAGFVFFLVAASIGALLRIFPYFLSPKLNYSYFLHAHSHVAFLAWVFNAFFAIALGLFVREVERPAYFRLFLVAQVANVGMLIAFPLQGYAAWSIAFTTLHLLCSVLLIRKIWRSPFTTDAARPYLLASILFMLASNLGPLALGPLAALEMRDSPWYTLSIYFYMHFQYNGWFLFFLLAACLQVLPKNSLLIDKASKAFPWLLCGAIFTLFQSALWASSSLWINGLSLLGSSSQIYACIILFRCHQEINTLISRLNSRHSRKIARIVLLLFIAKIGMQFTASLPGLVHFAIDRYAAIGYMHLVFLGIVTPTLFAWAIERRWLSQAPSLKPALILYALGVALTEVVLVYTPIATYSAWRQLPHREPLLAIAAFTILISLSAMLPCLFRPKASNG
ncbi:MAG: hypothetical protein AAGB46_01235 [Verrucomicrobiota bacterium]